jgi:RNA polymerase sigma-70 factor (ECF subfamily)
VDDEAPALEGSARFEHYVVPEIDVMLRVARSLTGQAAEAEDLVQDSLLRAFRAIDGFDGQHPRAWLLTIVRNTHINRNRRRRPSLLDDPDAHESAASADSSSSAEQIYVDGSFGAAVEAALATLTTDARRVIELVDLGGLTYAEAAEVLDVPVGTVMSRLHRARRKIRDELDGHGLAPRRSR